MKFGLGHGRNQACAFWGFDVCSLSVLGKKS